MRRLAAIASVFLAGCLAAPVAEPPTGSTAPPALNTLEAPGATIIEDGTNRTFEWRGDLGRGAAIPLAGAAPGSASLAFEVPVDASVGTLTLELIATDDAFAQLRTDEGRLACAPRAGRVCSVEVPNEGPAAWALTITSLAPQGSSYVLRATLHPGKPAYGTDPTVGGLFDVFEAGVRGGEPTLAVLKAGRVLVVAGASVLRLDLDGSYTDVTPPLDEATRQTLDPFLVGDPVTDRVYVSQLASCMRLSWTDDAGGSWTTNPMTCGGPELHHQKLAVGPGPVGRAVHLGMMNLASWLATDEVVVTHARSFDGGVAWTQNPALVKQVHGMEARAVGNVAVGAGGVAHIIAYLCDAFVDAEYNGVGVGRSTDFGATWTWQRIGQGGGRCEGIDPGIAAVGESVHAGWWDFSDDGTPRLWYARSTDAGATWSEQAIVPTPGIRSFVFADAAASEDRWSSRSWGIRTRRGARRRRRAGAGGTRTWRASTSHGPTRTGRLRASRTIRSRRVTSAWTGRCAWTGPGTSWISSMCSSARTGARTWRTRTGAMRTARNRGCRGARRCGSRWSRPKIFGLRRQGRMLPDRS